ncbi:hypothetical protein SprV_0200780600 [Sparganum proliferum]
MFGFVDAAVLAAAGDFETLLPPSADPLQCGHAILQPPCAVEAIEAVTTHRHLSILHSVRPVQNSIALYLDPKTIIDRLPTASL